MTDDDRRAAYLAEHDAGGLTAAEVADLDGLRDLLEDEAAWVEPPGDLGERIAASIAAERNAEGNTQSNPESNVVALAPRRSLRWPLAILGAAAAVIAIVLAITLSGGEQSKARTHFAAALTGTPLAPGASGHVTLTKTHGGWRIKLDASGLPRRDPPQYYEAWLKNAAGVLVPIGTFNSGPHVTLWSAVSPADFPTLTITKQTVGAGENSSGLVVLSGQPTEVH